MKNKILSLALALALCLSLAVPALAAETLTGDQLHGDGWGNGPSLTLTGVVKGTETQFDPSYIYDVEVGGSLVLEMTYPAGKNRSYNIMNGGFYVPHDLKEPDWNDEKAMETLGESWDIPKSAEGGDFNESSGKTRFVYTFTASDMGQKNGMDKIIYPMIYWCDDANNDGMVDVNADGSSCDGGVYFGIRVVPAQSTTGFSDVKDSDYFAAPVKWAVEKKITDGTSKTTFSPERTCTQAQILTFLWRAKGEPAPEGAVSGTEYYAKAAQWAKEQGLLEAFTADDPCTRAMVVTYLWKLAGSPAAKAADFSDVAADADYAKAVSWAVETGVTDGTGNGQFSPDKTCTRGQIVTFLYRALEK